MKMKKMIFLMLLSFLGITASMNAQVRIGGTDEPNASALLDVNKTDDPNPAGNLGLGLPRVELTSATQPLATGNTPKPGTMVYNTGSALDGAGVYYWATNAWAKLSSGNAGTATKLATARAITLTGNVTGTADFDGSAAASIATTLADNAVTSAKIANGAVTLDDLAANSVNSSQIVDGSVTSDDIADLTIVNADIANATIAGGKLVSSIALAGSPTTTTQPSGTSNTTIATTEFVTNAAAAAAGASSIVKRVFYVTSSVTSLTGVDVDKTACMSASSTYGDSQSSLTRSVSPTTTGATTTSGTSWAPKFVCVEFY
ncbi:hypothetical protein FACS189440_07420 [Bacteroidia bacterium]|nr:hypothetical protein FACS189440_07420 [Bacteroidia bacterium]